MPKMKTSSGAAKRFKRTAKGLKYRHAFRNHILTKKTTKRKRQLRSLSHLNHSNTILAERLLPY